VELPALWIREDLPPDLAGLCFNCLLPADHISRNCTRETACLHCRKGGHHAKDCPEGRAPAGVGQRRPDPRGPAAPVAERRLAEHLDAPPRRGWERAASPVEVRGRERPVSPVEGRRAGPASPVRRGGVHARLGPLGTPSSPPPMDAAGAGASRAGPDEPYRVPARRRLGGRAPSPPAPPSSVGSRVAG
jgi:hypothetical protein